MRDAILNYLATDVGGGSYAYEVYYQIDAGDYYPDIELNMSGDRSKLTTLNSLNSPGQMSTFTNCYDGNTITVHVADVSDNTKYYKSVYAASGGSITAVEHNISTTITAL